MNTNPIITTCQELGRQYHSHGSRQVEIPGGHREIVADATDAGGVHHTWTWDDQERLVGEATLYRDDDGTWKKSYHRYSHGEQSNNWMNVYEDGHYTYGGDGESHDRSRTSPGGEPDRGDRTHDEAGHSGGKTDVPDSRTPDLAADAGSLASVVKRTLLMYRFHDPEETQDEGVNLTG